MRLRELEFRYCEPFCQSLRVVVCGEAGVTREIKQCMQQGWLACVYSIAGTYLSVN